MRIREVIVENIDEYIDEVLEDEADGRGDANLLTTLEFLRNRAHVFEYCFDSTTASVDVILA